MTVLCNSWMSVQYQRHVHQDFDSCILPPIFSPSRRARALIWGGIFFTVLGYMTITIAMLAWMVPHRGDGGWGSLANVKRMGVASRQLDFTQGIFSVLSDFYGLTIPTGIVSRLNMKTQKKIGVACIFLFGFV